LHGIDLRVTYLIFLPVATKLKMESTTTRKCSTIKDRDEKAVEISCCLTANKNVEASGIIPSVPLDIALLHIETDALLDSLRNSAITPMTQELSPTSTTGSDSTYTLACTFPRKESADNSNEEDDDLSIDSDDGMRVEIQKLHKATTEINQSFANLAAQNHNNSIGELYKLQTSDEVCDNVTERHQKSDDVLLLLVREILMICEETFMLLLRNPKFQTMLRSKAFQNVVKGLKTRPREVAFLYIFLYAAFIWMKHRLSTTETL